MDALITEATLRGLFSMYGEIVDVAIKKTQFDKKLKIQNGYGFVHYALTPEGVQSAVTATKAIHQVTIDRVTYDCSLSHALETIVGPEVAAEIYSPKRPLAHTMSMSTYENQGSSMPTYGMSSTPISPRAELGGVGSTYGSTQLSNSIPRPAPINVNQQLPPLPPHHHYHQSPIGGGGGGMGIPFPHEDLEKRGLRASNNSSYSPTSSNGSGVYSPTGATSSSASLLQAYYGGEQGLGAASNEFYGIADMKKSPRLPEYSGHSSGLSGGLSPGGSSTYYNSSNGNSYLEYSSQSSGRNSHSYPHSNASTSSASLSSYNNDGLALSDSESEAGPFERLSLAERMANTKPSPTNSMRSLENRSSTVTSNDRSPRNSGNYTGYVNNTSNVNPSMMSMSTSQNQLFLASNSIDSTLSLSTLSSNNSTYHRYDVTPPSSMLGPSNGNNNALSPSSYHGNVLPPQQKNHNQFQTYNNDINNHHSNNQQSNVMSMGGHNWNR